MKNLAFVLTVVLGCGSNGCAGGQFSRKVVDTPRGHSSTYGAPRSVSYSFEAEPELDQLRIHVYRSARCDVIPFELVARRTETWKGDSLVSAEENGTVQNAGKPTSDAPCDQGYASDVEVSLVVGNAVHLLGTTNEYGYVGVNLNAELRERLFGAGVPAQAVVRVRAKSGQPGQDIGQLSLASLRDFQSGTQRLLGQFTALLAKGTELNGQEIQKTYELYEKLRATAWYDPAVKAASARFWELFFARKQVESTQNLSRNLKALESAKDLLKVAGAGAVPLFMQVAIASQAVDARAVDWASGELLTAFRAKPSLCASFDWTQMQGLGLSPLTQIAVQYLRFAQGDSFYTPIASRCSFLARGL